MELVLFLIIAGVAIAAAVGMLVSENAVHSALFLIVNFACVAFLYLMLDAAFLFTVQITVYAGAIMVLFMFVIMLLGAERMAPDEKPRFPWLTPVAVGLTIAFLTIAGLVIMDSDIEGTVPQAAAPQVRILNAVPELEAVDIRVNGETVLSEVEPYEPSDFEAWAAGEYTLEVVPHGEVVTTEVRPLALLYAHDPYEDMNVVDASVTRLQAGNINPPVELETTEPILTLEGGETLTLVLTTLPNGQLAFIPVYQNLETFGNQKLTRVQLVHADPNTGAVDLVDITEAGSQDVYAPVENLQFGEISTAAERRTNDYRYGVYEAGIAETTLATSDELTLADVDDVVLLPEAEFERDTSTLYVLAPPRNRSLPGQHPIVVSIPTANHPAFGGPTSVGQALFTKYMLPFQAIALLLLVAMIGAIVLTRDAIPLPKPRFGRRLANTGKAIIVSEPSQD